MSTLIIAPIEALTDPDLTDTERRVLLVLYSFRNRNTDIVWPSIEKIAERALINDEKRVSKITTSLCQKGWLKKDRSGFSGRVEYKINIPEHLYVDEVAESTTCERVNTTKVAKFTTTKVAESTTSEVAKSTTFNEQQIEQYNILSPVEDKKTAKPEEVKKLYNEILGPKIGNIRGMTSSRIRALNARIKEDKKRESADWWRAYFLAVSETPFLIGKGPTRELTGRPFKADFDFLVNENSMNKTLEGKYL